MKKILISGFNGHLGSYLYKNFFKKGYITIGLDRELTLKKNSKKLINFIKKVSPDVLINCAAIVGLKNSKNNKKLTREVNIDLPVRLANICKKKIHFIQISTNSSFEGLDISKPRNEDEKGKPLSFYGQTKYQADIELLKMHNKSSILRVANLFSSKIEFNSNILKGILRNLSRNEVVIKRNELLSPVSVETVSKAIEDIIINNARGIYHCVDAGICNWETLISFISKKLNKKPKVKILYKKNEKINSTLSSKNPFCYYGHWKLGLDRSLNSIIKNKYEPN
jgi:dTDP-4-dehydrorhamnose reductase